MALQSKSGNKDQEKPGWPALPVLWAMVVIGGIIFKNWREPTVPDADVSSNDTSSIDLSSIHTGTSHNSKTAKPSSGARSQKPETLTTERDELSGISNATDRRIHPEIDDFLNAIDKPDFAATSEGRARIQELLVKAKKDPGEFRR